MDRHCVAKLFMKVALSYKIHLSIIGTKKKEKSTVKLNIHIRHAYLRLIVYNKDLVKFKMYFFLYNTFIFPRFMASVKVRFSSI